MSKVGFSISIVTLNKNNTEGLRRTLISASRQKVMCKEILVIDASDKEAAIDAKQITSNYENAQFINQSTRGIYEAMNQGLGLAEGDWIWFMNSGDEFYDEDCIGKAQDVIMSSQAKVYVGGHKVIGDNYEREVSEIEGVADARRFAYVLRQLNHQSTVYERSALLAIDGFDVDWSFCADYASVISIALENGPKSILFFPSIISVREPGGLSDNNLVRVQWEKHLIRARLIRRGRLQSFLWFGLHILYYFQKYLLSSLRN